MKSWCCAAWLLPLHCGLALKFDDAKRQPNPQLKGARGFLEGADHCWDADVWGDTPYPLSEKMCKRTHIHHGDVKTSGTLLTKLHHGECVRVAVLGGSVSAGICLKCNGYKHPDGVAWPNLFKKWLDTRFPCGSSEGHIIDNYSDLHFGTEIHLAHLPAWKSDPTHNFWSADMVVVETTTDDDGAYQGYADYALENPKDLTPLKRIRSFTEALARELISHPKKPWLLWAELGWRDFEPGKRGSGHTDANLWHLPILQYYDIDQVSMVDAFLPLSTTDRRQWLRDNFFADTSNPSPLGHTMCSQVVARAMMHNSHLMNLALQDRRSWFDPEKEMEPPPLDLSIAASRIYADGRAEKYSFTTGDNEAMRKYILNGDGFAMSQDPNVRGNVTGKIGLIATQPESHVQIGVPVPLSSPNRTHTRFHLGLLKSYEHMGIARIKYGIEPQACSASLFTKTKLKTTSDIDCLWSVMASTRQVEEFTLERPQGEDACLLVEVEARPATPPRKENKIKVLDLHVM